MQPRHRPSSSSSRVWLCATALTPPVSPSAYPRTLQTWGAECEVQDLDSPTHEQDLDTQPPARNPPQPKNPPRTIRRRGWLCAPALAPLVFRLTQRPGVRVMGLRCRGQVSILRIRLSHFSEFPTGWPSSFASASRPLGWLCPASNLTDACHEPSMSI